MIIFYIEYCIRVIQYTGGNVREIGGWLCVFGTNLLSLYSKTLKKRSGFFYVKYYRHTTVYLQYTLHTVHGTMLIKRAPPKWTRLQCYWLLYSSLCQSVFLSFSRVSSDRKNLSFSGIWGLLWGSGPQGCWTCRLLEQGKFFLAPKL